MKNLAAVDAATKIHALYAPGTLVDTHQFERDAMAQCPDEFMQDFLAYNCDLTTFSRDFSLWIRNNWSSFVADNGKKTSANLRGTNSENHNWKII